MLSHALRAKVQNGTIPTNSDPNFKQVSLLLHGDGTNGAQNNTFIGEVNPAQYYGTFNGSTQYLTVPSSSAFAYGTGDFTVEFWFNAADTTWRVMYEQPSMVSIQWSSTSGGGGGAGKVGIYWSGGYAITSNIALSTATWYHLSVVRQSGVLKLYIDGVLQTTTSSTSVNITATTTYIGNYYAGGYGWNGKLSNVRVVKGTALYTSNFTPPTGNLTAVTGTQLLTLQNATIVDNSTNNFTITNVGSVAMTDQYPTVTRNGNTTQGTNTPFSQAAGAWSNYFDGTGDNLTVPSGAAFQFGTGDFTIEAWVYLTSAPQFQYIIDARNAGQTTNWALGFGLGPSPSQLCFYTGSTALQQTTPAINANTWVHCVVARSGTTLSLFANGVRVATTTDSTNFSISPTISYIGSRYSSADYMTGYLSNVRTVKGTAVYNPTLTTLTVPTAPLTAITNTSLLTCQSNNFKDNSSNNFTITRNGDTSVQPFSPFAPTAAYSTSVNGGSMYFDGTGDSLSTPYNAATDLTTGNFTVEGWFYLTKTNTRYSPIINGTLSNVSLLTDLQYFIGLDGTTLIGSVYSGNTSYPITFTSISVGAWHHFALVRNGTAVNFYLNGVQNGTTQTVAGALHTNSFLTKIGYYSESGTPYYFNGYVSNTSIVKGTAVYTATFTPPTAPLTAITNTSLLLSGTNAGIYDNAIKNDLETGGNAQVSTSVVKYGTGSMKFDGTGDYLKIPDSPQFNLGTGNFTIEMWIYTGSPSSIFTMINKTVTNTSNQKWINIFAISGTFYVFASSNNSSWDILNAASFGSIATNTWQHIALVRNGTSFVGYLNGVGTSLGTSSLAISNNTDSVAVGGYIDGAYSLNGYIDDLRITKGVARYTANFTPPTAPFPNQ